MQSRGTGEFQPSDDVQTGFISGNTFERKEVTFSVVDGWAIFEGYKVLGTVEELTQQNVEPSSTTGPAKRGVVLINSRGVNNEAIGITGSQYRWRMAIIPFQFGQSFTRDRTFL